MQSLFRNISVKSVPLVSPCAVPIFHGRELASSTSRQLSVKWDIFEKWITIYRKQPYETEQEKVWRFGYFVKRHDEVRKKVWGGVDGLHRLGWFSDRAPDEMPVFPEMDTPMEIMNSPEHYDWANTE